MTDTRAFAYRRAGLVGAALLATATAHGLTLADWHVSRGAPVAWAGWISAAVLVGRRGRPWRERSLARTVILLLTLQFAAHACLTFAPWMLGLAGHSEVAAIGFVAIAAHCAAALVLALVIRRGERVLTRAINVVETIARRLRGTARGAAPRAAAIRAPAWRPRTAASRLCVARGPPMAG